MNGLVDGDKLTKELKNEPRTGGAQFLLANGSKIEMFTGGPGATCPGIMITLDNGDEYMFMMTTGKPIIDLHVALGMHMKGMSERAAALFTTMHEHEEIGCKLTHEVFEQVNETTNVILKHVDKVPTGSHTH